MQQVKMAVPTRDAGDYIRHLDYWREHEVAAAVGTQVEVIREEHEGRVAAVDRMLAEVREPLAPLVLVASDAEERFVLTMATDRMLAQVAKAVTEVDIDDYEGFKQAADVVCQWAERAQAFETECLHVEATATETKGV